MAAEVKTSLPAQDAKVPPGPVAEFWHYFSENLGAVGGLVLVLVILAAAIFAPLIAPHDPAAQDPQNLLLPPAFTVGGKATYLLGTDAIGRDIFSRIVFGARYSLFIGLVVVLLSLVAGVALGLVAGFYRGWIETVIVRLMDIFLALPNLLLAIVIVAILGPGLLNAIIAVAVTSLPHFTRLARASAITEMSKDYVVASRVSGAGPLRIMLSEVLPNCSAPLIVQATLGFSDAILAAAALGFLGLGAQPPTPEWGTMLADAREFVLRAWWVVTFPGLAILITVLAFNVMGDGLRDALDPRLKRS